MKTSQHYLLGLLSMGALASCSNDLDFEQLLPKPEPAPESSAITFSVAEWEQDGQTRTAYSKNENGASVLWTAGDAIGVYPFLTAEGKIPASRTQIDFFISEGTASASKCVFDGGSWSLRNGWLYWAYYPYSSSNTSYNEANNLIGFIASYTDPLTQEGNDNMDHLAAQDYMYAVPKEVSDNGSINFEMQHLSSILEIDLKFPECTAAQVQSLNLSNSSYVFAYRTNYQIDNAGSLSVYARNTANRIGMKFRNTTIDNNHVKAYLMAGPTIFYQNYTFTVEVATSAGMYTGTIDSDLKAFEGGNIYQFGCDLTLLPSTAVGLGTTRLDNEETLYSFTPDETGYYLINSNYVDMDSFGVSSVRAYNNGHYSYTYPLQAGMKYFFTSNSASYGEITITKIPHVGLGVTRDCNVGLYTFVPESDGYYFAQLASGLWYLNWYFSDDNRPTEMISNMSVYNLQAGVPYLISTNEASDLTINKCEEIKLGETSNIPNYGGLYYFSLPAQDWIGLDCNTEYSWYWAPSGHKIRENYISSPSEGLCMVRLSASSSPIVASLSSPAQLHNGKNETLASGCYYQYTIPEDGYYYFNSQEAGISIDNYVQNHSPYYIYEFKKDSHALIHLNVFGGDRNDLSLTVGKYTVLKEGSNTISSDQEYVFVPEATDYYALEDATMSFECYDGGMYLDRLYSSLKKDSPYRIRFGQTRPGSVNIKRLATTEIGLNTEITESGMYNFTPTSSGYYYTPNAYGSWKTVSTNSNIASYNAIVYLEAGVKYGFSVNLYAPTRIIKLNEKTVAIGQGVQLSPSDGDLQLVKITAGSTGLYVGSSTSSSLSAFRWLGWNNPELISVTVVRLIGGESYICMVHVYEDLTFRVDQQTVQEITAVKNAEYTIPAGSVAKISYTSQNNQFYTFRYLNGNYGPIFTGSGQFKFIKTGQSVESTFHNQAREDVRFTITDPETIDTSSSTMVARAGIYYFTPPSDGIYEYRLVEGPGYTVDEYTSAYLSIYDEEVQVNYEDNYTLFGGSTRGTSWGQTNELKAGKKYAIYFSATGSYTELPIFNLRKAQ